MRLRISAILAITFSAVPVSAASPVKTMNMAKEDQLVCRDIKSAGSGHSMRVCRKNQEWAQVDVDRETTLKDAQDHNHHTIPSAHPPKVVK